MMKCPACDGDGYLVEEIIDHYTRKSPCGFCCGKGHTWNLIALWYAFADIRNEKRMRKRYQQKAPPMTGLTLTDEELRKVATERIDNYIDMGCFANPDQVFPALVEGFELGYKYARVD
jgi:hypothetical protein